jgi:hypothetical protein
VPRSLAIAAASIAACLPCRAEDPCPGVGIDRAGRDFAGEAGADAHARTLRPRDCRQPLMLLPCRTALHVVCVVLHSDCEFIAVRQEKPAPLHIEVVLLQLRVSLAFATFARLRSPEVAFVDIV